jgi:ATP-dependent Clp endopeptidase proteolytic subunit ClpP
MDHDALRQKIRQRLPRAAGRSWFDIKNADGEVATVRIYDEISWWGISADEFASEIANITAPEIEVQINSPGGDVFDGLAIYNALRMHPAKVTTRVDGMAASIASVIVQAGDRRVIVKSAQMMIHEAWGLCIGPAGDMRAFADLLDQQNDVIAGIYADRSGKPVDEFRELMRSDLYLTDEQALDHGLVDEIFVPERKTAARMPMSQELLDDWAGLAEFREDLERRFADLAAKIPAVTGGEPSPTPGASTPTDANEAEVFARALLASITKENH